MEAERRMRKGGVPCRVWPSLWLALCLVTLFSVSPVALSPAFAADGVETETIILPRPDSAPAETPSGMLDDVEPLQSTTETELTGDNPDQPHILRDVEALPSPVRRTRMRMIEAARTGDPQALRPIIESLSEPPTMSSLEELDPVEALKEISGDGEGLEALAIMIEVLEAGFVHVDVGTDHEHFLWPYFSRTRIDALTPEQKVELFELVTAFDYENMQEFGAYNFFRLGIAPDGQWLFFIAGD